MVHRLEIGRLEGGAGGGEVGDTIYAYIQMYMGTSIYKYYNTERALFVNEGRDGRLNKQAGEDTEITLIDWWGPRGSRDSERLAPVAQSRRKGAALHSTATRHSSRSSTCRYLQGVYVRHHMRGRSWGHLTPFTCTPEGPGPLIPLSHAHQKVLGPLSPFHMHTKRSWAT